MVSRRMLFCCLAVIPLTAAADARLLNFEIESRVPGHFIIGFKEGVKQQSGP